ncbi:MAG: FecR domain-containing protein [Gammaproteobacteria bacterium]
MNTASEFEAQAAAWLVRREAPDFSERQQAEFDAWAEADPRHRAAFVRLEAAWRRADRLRKLRPLDGEVDENLLAHSPFARLEEYPARHETRNTSVGGFDAAYGEERSDAPRRRRWVVSAAAAALALIVIAASTWFALEKPGWQRYSTDFGGFEKIVLDDGSVVHLNTNSSMRVHLSATLRQVVLDRGEALFKVAHDRSRPFDVRAVGTTVRAVGTEFSVRVREANEVTTGLKDVEVLVREGRVAIDPPTVNLERATALPRSLSTLSAGETVTITANRVHVQRVAEADVNRKLSWTEGRLWFERQRLADVVAEFNRYNRRQMIIADPAIADLRIGGGFEATDPESFVAALERTLGVRAFPSTPGGDEPDVIRLVGTGDRP